MAGEHLKKIRSMMEARMMEIKLEPKTGIEYADVGRDMIYNELNRMVLASEVIEKSVCDECGVTLTQIGSYTGGPLYRSCECRNDE